MNTEELNEQQLGACIKSRFMLGAMLLPEEPTELSLFKAREIIVGYAESGQQMPPKLLKHLSMLLDVNKPIRTVQKANRDRNKALDVLDVLLLQYWCGMSRMGACEAVYHRDGNDEDPKTLNDNISRKQFAVTNAEFAGILEETFSTYGTRDSEELKLIILTAQR